MKINWSKILKIAKRVGYFLAAFIIIGAFLAVLFGWQGVCWSKQFHPDSSWWALGVASIIVTAFASLPMFYAVKWLIVEAMKND